MATGVSDEEERSLWHQGAERAARVYAQVLIEAFGGDDAISPELRIACARVGRNSGWDDLQVIAAAIKGLRGLDR
jgi:hypothetical protein